MLARKAIISSSIATAPQLSYIGTDDTGFIGVQSGTLSIDVNQGDLVIGLVSDRTTNSGSSLSNFTRQFVTNDTGQSAYFYATIAASTGLFVSNYTLSGINGRCAILAVRGSSLTDVNSLEFQVSVSNTASPIINIDALSSFSEGDMILLLHSNDASAKVLNGGDLITYSFSAGAPYFGTTSGDGDSFMLYNYYSIGLPTSFSFSLDNRQECVSAAVRIPL